MRMIRNLTLVAAAAAVASTGVLAQDAGHEEMGARQGGELGWGPADEVGNLNEMTDASRLAALRLATRGKVYDLGLPVLPGSFKWPGHSAGEIASFRSPAGVRTQQDMPFTTPGGGNTGGTAWHSNVIFMNDNVATQIDGLAHITHGPDSHFYNGMKAADWGGDFGLRKADVTTIPPIVAAGRSSTSPASRRSMPSPRSTRSPSAISRRPWRVSASTSRPAPSCWSAPAPRVTGAPVEATTPRFGEHDSAGIGLRAAKWLVEQKGVFAVGTDTSGVE